MHKWKIKAAANGQFRVQFVYNAEVMVWSENYAGKPSAKNCIESMKKNAPGAPTVDLGAGEAGKGYRFEIKKNKAGEFMVNFVAANGEPLVQSEGYKSKSSARNCIASLQKNGPKADTLDETAK